MIVVKLFNLRGHLQEVTYFSGAATVLPITVMFKKGYPGTMATADCTTSTHDEGECWEEGLHSLSCSEDEDRGELVCTGLIFI